MADLEEGPAVTDHPIDPDPQVDRASKRRKLIALWSTAVVIVAVASTAWLGTRASIINSELQSVKGLLPQLKQEFLEDDSVAAGKTLTRLTTHTVAARDATYDPVWTVAEALPWLGVNFRAASELARSANDVAQLGAVPLVTAFNSLDWKSLTPNDKGVNLTPIAAAEPKLSAAAHAVGQSSDRLKRIDAGSLLPQIAEPLISARDELDALRGSLDTAADVSRVAPEMLGANGGRRYLLLIQNNAEARASGGIPGALAVLSIDKGKLTLGAQTSASALGAFNPPINIDPEQEAIYSIRLGKFMQDVNLTPDFPSSATLATAMWERSKGEHLDGAISIDPVALSYIMRATGPVHVRGSQEPSVANSGLPTELNASNVVKTLLSDVYSKIPDPRLQDAYFADVAGTTFEALTRGTSDPKQLLGSLQRGADEGRIMLWSSSPAEQSVISNYRLSGSVSGPNVSPAQFGVYFNDGTGAKMDYYVKRSVQLVKECTTNGYRQVKVRVTSKNTAPRDAAITLPEYVTGAGVFGVPEGTVQTNIVAYGPVQSNVETAVIDGKKTGFSSQLHSGRPVGSTTLSLAPGQSSTVEFTFDKIVQHSEPQLSVTPTVQALKDVVLDTVAAKCAPAA